MNSLSFLNRSRGHQSSELVDKIYGVYSILEILDVSMPEPDYTVPVHLLCEEITIAIILQQQSLVIFEFLRSHSRIPDLPSWVPDWTSSSLSGSQLRWDVTTKINMDTNGIIGRQPNQLPLKGKFVSKIGACEERGLWELFLEDKSLMGSLDWNLALVACLRRWFRFVNIQSPCSTTGRAMTAFRESFIRYNANTRIVTENKNIDPWEDFFANLEQTSRLCELRGNIERRVWEEWVKARPRHWQESLRHESDNSDVRFLFHITRKQNSFWNIQQEIFLRLHMRNIFMTGSWHLGIGPAELREGDSIVLFPGALSPMIVRPLGPYFQLIGPAVIHELMYFKVRPNTLSAIINGWPRSEKVVKDRESMWPMASSELETFIMV
jgi:hypothetical protein